MKKILAAFLATLLWAPVSWAQDSAGAEVGLDERINQAISPVTNAIAGIIFYSVPVGEGVAIPIIVVWLVVAALFATFYFNFISVRAFGHAVDLVKGDYSNPKDAGEVSHFQALATALSGTVGLGNIAGVAIAVSIGGPGRPSG